MSNKPRSLHHRLLLGVLGAVVCVWLGTALMTWMDARHELNELLDAHLAQAAAVLVVQQAQAVDDDAEDQGVDAPTLHRYAPKVAFQVFHEGQLALRSANAPAAPMVSSGKGFQTGFATVQIAGTAWRVFATYGAKNDVHVYVGEELVARGHILWAVLRSTLWPMAVALPLLALALWWAVARGVAPLRALGRTLAQRQPDALSPITLEGASLEMLPMVEALNALLGRIGLLLESERRFTADASHELRTPIAAIRTQAQVALGATDDAARRHALHATLAGCDRATRLVEQLLTLSRLEAADAPTLGDVDLSALARQVVGDLAPQAIAKGQTLELDAPTPCHLGGNDTLLAVLVRNLVDNAIRYSPPKARIHVAVAVVQPQPHGHGQVLLCVEDSGPGLSESDCARLGERFFRLPGQLESGSGLGWSIVRRIASAHRLEVQLQHSPSLGGLAVQISGKCS
jgi:two-component system sensor histidine kinase QseC